MGKIIIATILLMGSPNAQAGRFSILVKSLIGNLFHPERNVANFDHQPHYKPLDELDSISKLISFVYDNEKRKLNAGELNQINHWLSCGADVEERDEKWHSTPIMFAVQAVDLPLIELLLKYNANIWAKNGKYQIFNYIRDLDDLYKIGRITKSIPLVVSFILNRESRNLASSELVFLEELIVSGANIHERTADGKTALHIAQELQDFTLVKFLRAYSRISEPVRESLIY